MRHATKIVGILNITPDSFSNTEASCDKASIIASAKKLIADGCDVIDIGAESTRPGATSLTHIEEWQRLEDVLLQICELTKSAGILASIDTRHAKTAINAIACGIDWVNDVTGCDAEMLAALSGWNGSVVIMHNLGVPADKTITLPDDCNPVAEVINWLKNRLNILEEAGISKDRVIIDPGIGFGKTAAQSWQLVNNIDELQSLGVGVLVGHSRKSFLDFNHKTHTPLAPTKPENRDAQTIEVSRELTKRGVSYLRVHNVLAHISALKDI